MKSHGMSIDSRHVMLLADLMTYKVLSFSFLFPILLLCTILWLTPKAFGTFHLGSIQHKICLSLFLDPK